CNPVMGADICNLCWLFPTFEPLTPCRRLVSRSHFPAAGSYLSATGQGNQRALQNGELAFHSCELPLSTGTLVEKVLLAQVEFLRKCLPVHGFAPQRAIEILHALLHQFELLPHP